MRSLVSVSQRCAYHLYSVPYTLCALLKKVWEQTARDMDRRYASGGFALAGGNMQSLSFALTGMSRVLHDSSLSEMFLTLSEWDSTPLENGDNLIEGVAATFYDMGCAEGDGTAALSYLFPLSTVTGIDISPVAVERAKVRWPHLDFRVGDITKPDFERASIIFTSHTIEHLEHPADVIKDLFGRCSILIVIVPPIMEAPAGEAHVGAKLTKRWLAELPEPLYEAHYNTLRPDLEVGGVIEEGNVLLVWRGTL